MQAESWIRKRSRTLRFAGLALANAVFWIWLFVHVAGDPVFLAHNGGLAPFAAFFLGVAAASGVLAWRMACAGLWIAKGEVIVRGPFRTRRLARRDVDRVVPGVWPAGYGANGTPCPTLKLADGRAVGVWALGIDGLAHLKDARLDAMRPLCAELNRLLDAPSSAIPLE